MLWATLLRSCLRNADANQVEALILENGLNYITENGTTPLHLACLADSFPIVKLLIRHGADVNRRNYRGETALHYAARQASPELISFLLHHGADPSLVDNDYNTVLHWAAEDRPRNVIELLGSRRSNHKIKNNADRTPLETAIFFGNYEGVLALSGDMDKYSLAYAVECEQEEIFQLLLALGAEISPRDPRSKSALQSAIEVANPQICRTLCSFLHTTPHAKNLISPQCHHLIEELVACQISS